MTSLGQIYHAALELIGMRRATVSAPRRLVRALRPAGFKPSAYAARKRGKTAKTAKTAKKRDETKRPEKLL